MTDAHSFFGSQPTFHVDGREEPALAAQLIGLVLGETLGEPPRCEATFHNWVEGALAYPDDRTLAFARPLEIRLSGEVLFAGRIVALEGRFPAARPPELRAIAVGPVGAPDAHAGTLQLVHGAALRELHVTVERATPQASHAGPTTARGVAAPTSGLRVGVHIEVEGVGASFGGAFLVVETRQLFDQSHGLRTEFVATRGGR
jgi:hypothetical protein